MALRLHACVCPAVHNPRFRATHPLEDCPTPLWVSQNRWMLVDLTARRTDWGPALGGEGVVVHTTLPDVGYAFGAAEEKRAGTQDWMLHCYGLVLLVCCAALELCWRLRSLAMQHSMWQAVVARISCCAVLTEKRLVKSEKPEESQLRDKLSTMRSERLSQVATQQQQARSMLVRPCQLFSACFHNAVTVSWFGVSCL